MASTDLLMVYPSSLWPVAGGGARRALDLMAFLRKSGFRVTLVTIDHGAHQAALAAQCDALIMLPPSNPTPPPQALAKVKRVIANTGWFDNLRNTGLDAQRNRPLESLAAKTAEQLRPRAAIVHFARSAYCLDAMPPGTLKIVDTHDIQHVRHATARAAGGKLDRPPCTREEEIDALSRAEILLAITPGEGTTLRTMCPLQRVLLVSHAVSVRDAIPSPDHSRELLFVANLYDPNVRGLRRFLDESWPGIRKAHHNATLTVCGRVGDAFKRWPEGVHAEGVVENLDPLYARAALIINPVLYGTGQAIKTIEALARGRALVCSPDGLRGLEHTGEVPCRVALHGSQMTTGVNELLADATKRHALERRALEFARTKFAPQAVYGPLVNALGSSAKPSVGS